MLILQWKYIGNIVGSYYSRPHIAKVIAKAVIILHY